MAEILVVDDDESIATAFQHFLTYEGHTFRICGSAEDAVNSIAAAPPDIVFMDFRMPGRDGLQALQEIQQRFPDVYVVMMTAYGTSQTSIDAIRTGAFDYLTKPLDLDELRSVIVQALAAKHARPTDASPEVATLSSDTRLIGEASTMRDVYKMIGRLSTNDVPALIVGERGTGKALVVRTIHENSSRRAHPFVSIECAALPEAILETMLFDSIGGTRHLENVEALTPLLQARLARWLNDQRPVGTAAAAFRLLASTEHDLDNAVHSGAFSRELYELLTVVTIRLPPLRERRDDIPRLVTYFIHHFNEELNRRIKSVDEAVLKRLQDYSWPGNVGELERVVKRACIVARGDVITTDDISESLMDGGFDRQELDSALARTVRAALHQRLVEKSVGASPFHDLVETVESILVDETLAITNGNQFKAAEILGVNRATLRKKIPSDT